MASDTDSTLSLEHVLEHYDVPVVTGRNTQMVSCALHEDRTPSCSVNLEKNLWKCFSCNESGDGYSLVMKKEGVDFVGARSYAADHGLEDGRPRGGDERISGSAHGGRRTVSSGPGNRGEGSGYRPRWRRD